MEIFVEEPAVCRFIPHSMNMQRNAQAEVEGLPIRLEPVAQEALPCHAQPVEACLPMFGSSLNGLSDEEAAARLQAQAKTQKQQKPSGVIRPKYCWAG